MTIRLFVAAAAALLLMSCQARQAPSPEVEAGQIAPIRAPPTRRHPQLREAARAGTHSPRPVGRLRRKRMADSDDRYPAKPGAKESSSTTRGEIEAINDEAGQPLP